MLVRYFALGAAACAPELAGSDLVGTDPEAVDGSVEALVLPGDLPGLPAHILNFPGSIVYGLDGWGAATGVAAAVLGLADSLGLVVVAEGIETEAELEVLRGLGCQRGQGFLLGRPAPAGTIGHRITLPGRRG